MNAWKYDEDKHIYKSKPSNAINKKFQEMLMMSLTEDSDEDSDNPSSSGGSSSSGAFDSICYITHEPLKDYSKTDIYTLSCGHTFLKSALFNEVRQQKDGKNTYKNRYFRNLGSRRFICPYCRELHKYLLPAWVGFPFIPNINVSRKSSKMHYCMHEIKNGKRAGEYCGSVTVNRYCRAHNKSKKAETANSLNSNSVLELDSQNNPVEPSTCQAIIKGGSRKGQLCRCKKKHTIHINDLTIHLCGTHAKLYDTQPDISPDTPPDISPDTPPDISPNTPPNTCKTLIKSGKRKGQACGAKSKKIINGLPYCNRHHISAISNIVESLDINQVE